MAKVELAKVQVRNQKYYNKRTRDRKLQVGDSVLLLLPTERNKLTLAWRGPYKVVGIVGDVDYRVELSPDKVKTYHINMLKRYYCRIRSGSRLDADGRLPRDKNCGVVATTCCSC